MCLTVKVNVRIFGGEESRVSCINFLMKEYQEPSLARLLILPPPLKQKWGSETRIRGVTATTQLPPPTSATAPLQPLPPDVGWG